MDCRDAREVLDLLALGALSPDEAAPLEEHLARCANCSRYFSGSLEVVARLGLAAPVLEPPPRLRRRILTAALQRRQRPAAALGRLAWAGLTALTALAAALSAFFFVEWRVAQDDREELATQLSHAQAVMREHQELMQLFTIPDLARIPMFPQSPDLTASLYYYWSSQKRWGFIVGTALPPPPAGSTYQLWFVSGDDARGVGTFRPGEEGIVYHAFDLSVFPVGWRPSTIMVTVEPEGGSPRPSGRPIIVGTISR